ncbi:hypothetical protein ACFP65_10795 [Marinilactibacillus sp. GCM10026970]|uniref:hypothetical protein n=1 Tax=Marinilactibacillus sp. GCM10026970 TaxID=3252642 RepID=UPI003612B4E9
MESIKSLINIEILISAMSGLVVFICTHFFYRSKLRKEQKVRFQNVIGEEKSKSLLKYRKLLKVANTIEYYTEEKDSVEAVDDFFSGNGIYPASLNNKQTLTEFVEMITDLRQNDFENLNIKSAATLFYIERYSMNLLKYIRNFSENLYPLIGTMIIIDIQNWQILTEERVIFEINKHSVTLSLLRGKKWEKAKDELQNKLWNKSILKMLMNPETITEPLLVNLVEYLNECNEETEFVQDYDIDEMFENDIYKSTSDND